jgi:Glyoxalase-like domain
VKINHQVVVFDAADLAAESAFWSGLLGGTIDAEDDWHMVLVDGQPRVGVQLAPDHVPPGLAARDSAAADSSELVG